MLQEEERDAESLFTSHGAQRSYWQLFAKSIRHTHERTKMVTRVNESFRIQNHPRDPSVLVYLQG